MGTVHLAVDYQEIEDFKHSPLDTRDRAPAPRTRHGSTEALVDGAEFDRANQAGDATTYLRGWIPEGAIVTRCRVLIGTR